MIPPRIIEVPAAPVAICPDCGLPVEVQRVGSGWRSTPPCSHVVAMRAIGQVVTIDFVMEENRGTEHL